MKKLAVGILLLVAQAFAQTSPQYWPRCWEMKTDLMKSVNLIHKDPVREELGVTPLLFLWITGGRSTKLISIDDLAAALHRVRPSLGSVEAIKHHLINDLYDDWSRNVMSAGNSEASMRAFESLVDDYNRRFPNQGHPLRAARRNGGIQLTVDLTDDAVARAAAHESATPKATYQILFEQGVMKVNLIQGGNLHFSLDPVMRSGDDAFRLQRADGAFDLFDRIFRINSIGVSLAEERAFAASMLNYLSERGIGQALFDVLTDDELLRILARDTFTYRYLKGVYESTRGQEGSLEAVLKSARRARNVRFAVIVGVAGAVGSTIWALWPDSETEKALKRAIALVPTTWRTTPDGAILDSLSDLIDSTDSNEAIVSTIRGLGCDSAYALWTYVFKTNDEEG